MPKDLYPEAGDFILGTAQSIFKQGAFITLDEYQGKKGMLHISEISPKWVRNIRDYVKEGQKVVLKVLRVNPERGHIDLSLRRVNDAQRKVKLQEVKQTQRAENLLKIITKELEIPREELEKELAIKLEKKFSGLYEGIESIAANNELIKELKLPKKWESPLLEIINNNVKAPWVEITGYAELKSYQPNGVDIIRESLKQIQSYAKSGIGISYVSPPIYRVKVKASAYKEAEKILHDSISRGIIHIKKKGGEGELHRNLEKK